MKMEEIMKICMEALENAGYETYGYSEAYQIFTVSTSEGEITVDFDEN
jgi:hypothetical protein